MIDRCMGRLLLLTAAVRTAIPAAGRLASSLDCQSRAGSLSSWPAVDPVNTVWFAAKMDKSGENLDETGKSRPVWRRLERFTRAQPGSGAGYAIPGPAAADHDACLRSEAIPSHFVAREWRLASEPCREFHHGLLLLGGEARLAAAGDPCRCWGRRSCGCRPDGGRAAQWRPAASGHLMAMQPDLLEHTFRQVPEAGELARAAGRRAAAGADDRAAWRDVLARAMALITRELGDLGPGRQTVISSALVIASCSCGGSSAPTR